MALFAKKCAACGAKLPEKRMVKGLCDKCGVDLRDFEARLDGVVSRIEGAESVRKCYEDCLNGLRLVDEYRRFVEIGLMKIEAGSTYIELMKYFEGKALGFVAVVREQNAKRKYEKKIGLQLISDWRRAWEPVPNGCCRACGSATELNDVGYCYECVRRATIVPPDEIMEMVAAGIGKGLEGEELTNAFLDYKLKGVASLIDVEKIKISVEFGGSGDDKSNA